MRLTKKTSCLHKPLWWLCSMLVLAASCIVDQSDFLSGNGQTDTYYSDESGDQSFHLKKSS